MYPNISRIRDDCLRNGFKLGTNLSEVRGNGLIQLMESLMHYSMEIPNMCIIERVILQCPQIFKTQESVKEIMKKNDPVISAFAVLGNKDMDCNIRWLLVTLMRINEILPIRNILATAPPYIRLLYISPDSRIQPGETIQFQIKTISEAQIQWRKNFRGRLEIIVDHIRIPEYSTNTVTYKTKDTDKGFFYVEVNCLGGFREYSPQVYVGAEEDTCKEIEKYENCTYNITEESGHFQGTELIEDIVPSRESDGIKRVALLIGIMNYEKSRLNLHNLTAPENDILDLERVLLQIGFTVYSFVDLDEKKMTHILETFVQTYEEEKTYAVFYFAGHGNSYQNADHINLIDNQMSVSAILNILVRNKPKVLVSIFDMCRNDSSKAKIPNLLQEATIPHAENLILVMSTLPKQKSYEKKINTRRERTSLIMKALCSNLSRDGCKLLINVLLTNFLNDCENIEQVPTISSSGIAEVIGIDIPNRRIKPIIEWIKVPADRRLMNCLTVDFKIFHNILNIYVNITDKNAIKHTIQMISPLQCNPPGKNVADGYKVSLFNSNVIVEDRPSIEFVFSVINESSGLVKTDYNIKVHFPSIIVPFLSIK